MSVATAWDDVHDGREAFRRCVSALCSPGRSVPAPTRAGLELDPLLDCAATLLLALLDPGLGLAIAGDGRSRALGERLRARTGAAPAPLCDADFVLVSEGGDGAAGEARRGSLGRPEAGATLVYAGRWSPSAVALQGPGVEIPGTIGEFALPPGELRLIVAAAASPPAGLDAFVLSPDGLCALPRSVARHLG